jgi:hypothetical protein
MDKFTSEHLDKWLDRFYVRETEEWSQARAAIVRLVSDDPGLLASHSWSELHSMANGSVSLATSATWSSPERFSRL